MAAWNMVEMSNGTKYRVLMEYSELIRVIDEALKSGGLVTLPMGYEEPGSLVPINPQHIVALSDIAE
jgi:hypothetical protein